MKKVSRNIYIYMPNNGGNNANVYKGRVSRI